MASDTEFMIPVAKAGGKEVPFDWAAITSGAMKKLVIKAGLTVVGNAKNSKLPTGVKLKEMTPEKRDEAIQVAIDKALENLQGLIDGTFSSTKRGGKAKADKSDRLVAAEALRIARERVRDKIRNTTGAKISHYKASEITTIAREILAMHEDELMTQAREALKKRAEMPLEDNIFAKLHADPTLVAKANEKTAQAKAERDAAKAAKGPASAASVAGRVTPRARPTIQ